MWEEILRTAAGSGLWAVLFCLLLMYQLRDSRTRENKYRETIETLTDRLGALDKVEKGVAESLTILKSERARRTEKPAGRAAVVREESKADV